MTLLALPKPGPPCSGLAAVVSPAWPMPPNRSARRQAEDGRAADAQEVAARDAVAGVLAGEARDHEHGSQPSKERRWGESGGNTWAGVCLS